MYMRRLIKNLIRLCIGVVVVWMCFVIYSKYFIEVQDIHSSAPSGTQFVTLENGEEIAYQQISSSVPVTIVFVGGSYGWSGTWEQTMNALNEKLRVVGRRYNIIALDLPPFGYSTAKPENAYFRNIQAERLNQFRKAKNLNRVIFVGHSYGAGPIVEAAMRNPSGVERLIIVDGVLNIGEIKNVGVSLFTAVPFFVESFVHTVSHSSWIAENRLRSFTFIDDMVDDVAVDLYTRPFNTVGNSARLAQWVRDTVRDPLVYRSTRKEEYAKLPMPVRIIWGNQDTLTPLALGEELKNLVPHSTLDLLAGVGHMPMLEDPEQFDRALFDAVVE